MQRWNSQGPAANYLTKKPYQGINTLLLNCLGFAYPYFLTFKQTQQLGGRIKKGSKSLPVIYWQWSFYQKVTGRRDAGKKLTEEEVKKLPASAYIQGWLKVLRDDKRFDLEAAQKAVDYILGNKEGD